MAEYGGERNEEKIKPVVQHQKLLPERPCHKLRASLLSEDFDNFGGLKNWGIMALMIGGLKLLFENVINFRTIQWSLAGKNVFEEFPSTILFLCSLVQVFICFLIEKRLAVKIISERFGISIHIINIFILMLLPVVAIHVSWKTFSIVDLTAICLINSMFFLKLWSYIQVNFWCRQANRTTPPASSGRKCKTENTENNNDEKEHPTKLVQYPNNLKMNDLLYFLFAPTLCYEINFPRTSRIKKRFLMKWTLEIIFGLNLIQSFYQHKMIPLAQNWLRFLSNMDISKMVEAFLQLSFFNGFSMLFIFYLVFHSFLNLTAELLHFADRNFYCDWWNANNIDTFWRTWNQPVHRWCVRHLYIPVIRMGFSKTTATITVFFISAIFHEYLVSVPLKSFNIWSFILMMIQIPLSAISKYLEKNYGLKWGNMIVWCFLILILPGCSLMYYRDNADTINSLLI